jgi:hypothetical protein
LAYAMDVEIINKRQEFIAVRCKAAIRDIEINSLVDTEYSETRKHFSNLTSSSN